MKRIFFLLASALLVMAATRSASDGVYTKAQATRGQAAYREECAKCHSENLAGGEGAPGLVGSEFLNKWQGKTAGDLFERIQTTMPSDDPGSLSRRKCADITAYILSANEFPAGDKELESTADSLNEIQINSRK
ncbi:MAG: cytochrome c [Acidobacteriota bacterium]|nr:cytochrome c [Acidobacteriota bacterium]